MGASASIIGGFVAVFAVVFTATQGPRWTGNDSAPPGQPLLIREAQQARRPHVRQTEPRTIPVTRPVALPARPARRVAVALHRAGAAPHHRRRRASHHHARRPAPQRTAPPAPIVIPVAAPAPPAPVVVVTTPAGPATVTPPPPAAVGNGKKKIPPGQLKKQGPEAPMPSGRPAKQQANDARVPPGRLKKLQAGAVHIPPGQLKKLGAITPLVGQTPPDEGDRGDAPAAGLRGRGHGRGRADAG